MTKRRFTLFATSAAIAVALAACGTGSASHVVRGAQQPAAASSVTTATSASSVPALTPPTTAASDVLSTQTLEQVGAELGSLDNSLKTADTDLNDPQGDS
jgi:hypothetical protein